MFVVCWSSFVVGGSTLKKHLVKMKIEPTGRSVMKMTDENSSRPFRQRSTLYSNNESHLLYVYYRLAINNIMTHTPPPFAVSDSFPATLFYASESACAPACASASST